MTRPDRKRSIDKPVAVAVEGNDYFYALLARIRNDPAFADVQLWNFCEAPGYDPKRWLGLFKTLPNYVERVRAICFIRDAEDSAAQRQAELRGAFVDNGLAAPDQPLQLTPGPPVTGYLVMPHGKNSGCLENALLEAVRPNVPLACAGAYLTCVDRRERNDNWRAKVQVHAIIAAGDSPPMTLGESVQQDQLWDFSGDALRVMLDFISDAARRSAARNA